MSLKEKLKAQDVEGRTPTLMEEWGVFMSEETGEAVINHKQISTARMLENTDKFLSEATNVTDGMATYDSVLMKMVRRMGPKLIAYDVMGVQPTDRPNGVLFALMAKYAGRNGNTPGSGPGSDTPQGGAEALGLSEPLSNYSGTGTHAGTNPFSGTYSRGTGMATAAGETAPWAAMGITINKTGYNVVTRNLRADYSQELAQDMKSVHNLDIEEELVNIMTPEVLAEINREAVGTLYTSAKVGASWAGITTAGTYDLRNDSDGRWAVERYKGLHFAIERDANQVAVETRRGKGNFLILSANVASALAMAGILDYAPALEARVNGLQVDVTGTTFAGVMGSYKVFVDPYATGDGYLVGFKGNGQYDAGVFYCPYVPLQMVRATDPSNFQPALGFKTRYAMVANPFTTLTAGQNTYYRKAQVTNLL